jgi:uncharacterized spore protein YtfJ
MTEENSPMFTTSIKNQEDNNRLIERLYEVVDPETVFSKPRKSGDYTLITASEIVVGLGSGYGYGSGSFAPPTDEQAGDEQDVEIEIQAGSGSGGGGGGGGMASGRPVAVISVGPDGVAVHPVIDRTKLGIALLSAVGSMFLAVSRFKK